MNTELHSHLYGCLQTDDLRWLASINEPRWNIFSDSYRSVYGKSPNIDRIFDPSTEGAILLDNYYYFSGGSFAAFQTCFDLVIALSRTTPEELQEISRRVLSRQSGYVEQRMMFSPMTPVELYKEKVLALCQAFSEVELSRSDITPRIAMSVCRDNSRGEIEYTALRDLQGQNAEVRRFLTGLDFCAKEEGFPPSEKIGFFEKILQDNKDDPRSALAILYHVGESYTDKSVESAVRWIVQAARQGAHRLGHAIALGINPQFYKERTILEIPSERIAQIDFEIENAESLKEMDCTIDLDRLISEKKKLENSESSVAAVYDEDRLRSLQLFQNWAMMEIKKTAAAIESCPTSNLLIANLKTEKNHPLSRFLQNDLKVVIGSDDPGILRTSLEMEFEKISGWEGIDPNVIQNLKKQAENSISEIVSGRTAE